MIEAVQKLTDIVRLEAEIIDDMFLLLLQHVSAEDAGMAAIEDKIAHTAAMIGGADKKEHNKWTR